jgi:hypothetical protein
VFASNNPVENPGGARRFCREFEQNGEMNGTAVGFAVRLDLKQLYKRQHTNYRLKIRLLPDKQHTFRSLIKHQVECQAAPGKTPGF